jgi:hypothetical protein
VGNYKYVNEINVYTIAFMKSDKGLYIRLPELERNKLRLCAEVYANGNLSEWVRYCLREAPLKLLKNKRRKKSRE